MTNVIEPSPAATMLPAMVWLYDLGSKLLGGVAANPVVALAGAVAIAVAVAALAPRLGVLDRARRHPRAALLILVLILAMALSVGWYLTSPLVLSVSIDEPPPIVATTGAGSVESVRPAYSPIAASVPVESGTSLPSLGASAVPDRDARDARAHRQVWDVPRER